MADGTFEGMSKDKYLGETQINTGGKLFFTGVTTQIIRPNFSFFSQVKIPVYNYLYGNQGNSLTRFEAGFQINI